VGEWESGRVGEIILMAKGNKYKTFSSLKNDKLVAQVLAKYCFNNNENYD
jgi:hypothetical protein